MGVDDALLAALSEKAALEVAQAPNVSVITRQDVEALLGRERQRQLLGCADESGSCVAELAGALGAGLVLTGDLAKVGARFTVTLKLLSYAIGRPAKLADMPAVRAIVRDGAATNYRWSSIIEGIVRSQPFRTRPLARDTTR